MKTITIVALLFLLGCTKPEGDPVAAIQEAVFRFQFDHNASVQQQRAEVYFLALGDPHERRGVDPSDEFLARFASSTPRVAKFSAAARIDGGWVIDKKTEEGGIIFFVHDVRLIDHDTAEAKGGYLEDRRSASGNTFRLKRGWRGWRVVGETMEWISQTQPNQTPEPTTLAVTISAYAELAPSSVVAHL